jgi:hypothetical protein
VELGSFSKFVKVQRKPEKMNHIVKSDIQSGGYGEKWKNESVSSNESFTANEVIDAYESGTKDGEKRIIERIAKLAHEQTVRAMHVCEQIWLHLVSIGIEPISIHLKRDGMSAFAGLFVVREEKFLSDDFEDVYTFIFSVIDKVNTHEFHLGIHFLPVSGPYNKDMLLADGFVYSYNGK